MQQLSLVCHVQQPTGKLADGVGLATVLGDLVVDHRHDVRADGRLVPGREGPRGAGGLILLGVDGDERTCRGQRLQHNELDVVLLHIYIYLLHHIFNISRGLAKEK